MNKIAIVTTFRAPEKGYSLVKVVEDQIAMLSRYGKYGEKSIVVVATDGFVPEREFLDSCVEIRHIRDVRVENDVHGYVDHKDFQGDVEALRTSLNEALKDVSVVLTHDIPYQPAALKHNLALRMIAKERPDLQFRHWVHSATEPSLLVNMRGGGSDYLQIVKEPFPNSIYVTFNDFQVQRVAKWFNVSEGDVKVVHHPHDFLEYMTPLARDIAEEYNLLDSDRVCVFAARLDEGKQPWFIIEIAGMLKKTGKTSKVVMVDFQSASMSHDDPKYRVRERCKLLALDLGLGEGDVCWVSEFGLADSRRNDVDHKTIMDLYSLSNYHICPSRSETFYKGAQEAAAARVPLILNYDFPPFRSIYQGAALYRKFSSHIDILSGDDGQTNTNYTDRRGYIMEIANTINYYNEHSMVLKQFNYQRQRFNMKYIYHTQLAPLLTTIDANLPL